MTAPRALPDYAIPECLGQHAFCAECDGRATEAPCAFRVWCMGVRARADDLGMPPAAFLRDIGATLGETPEGHVWRAPGLVSARINDLWPIGARRDRPGAVSMMLPGSEYVTAFPQAVPGGPARPKLPPAPPRREPCTARRAGVAHPDVLAAMRPWLAEFVTEFARVTAVRVRDDAQAAGVGDYYLNDRLPPRGKSGYAALRYLGPKGDVAIAALRPYPRRRDLAIMVPVTAAVLGPELHVLGPGVKLTEWKTPARHWRACVRGIDSVARVRTAAAWIASLVRRGLLSAEPYVTVSSATRGRLVLMPNLRQNQRRAG